MKQISIVVVLIVSLFAVSASAEQKKAMGHKKAFTREYGMAGCGLGSMVVGKQGGQIFAATTNGTSYNQTFGISSATSNCIDSESEEVASRVDRFVIANKVALAGDIARGRGETLASLSEMLQCSNSDLLNSALQSNFSQIFPTYDVSANSVTDSIITVIEADSDLATGCHLVI